MYDTKVALSSFAALWAGVKLPPPRVSVGFPRNRVEPSKHDLKT
jgi:hypothetical protein